MGLAACSEQYEWNQELTVTVESVSIEVFGSSVPRVSSGGGVDKNNLQIFGLAA